MGFGALSSLGIGSNVLTYDIIDKLKGVDKKAQIDPIDKKIKDNFTQQKDLSAIVGLVNKFKFSVSSLKDDTFYAKKQVDTKGESATIDVKDGVSSQNINLEVEKLAKKDIYQSNRFTSEFSTIGSKVDTGNTFNEGYFYLKHAGENYKIDIKNTTTLNELAEIINDATQGEIQAKVMNVGGKDPYQLILSSKDTGEENKITISSKENDTDLDNTEGVRLLKALGWSNEVDPADSDSVSDLTKNRISVAQDAQIKFDGVEIIRSKNEISDLIVGVTFNLTAEGETSFKISNDSKDIYEEINNLVSSYNELINNIQAATTYDEETKSAGTFQGVSEVLGIKNKINNILMSPNEKGVHISKFGIDFNDDGLLKFDQGKFSSIFSKNPEEIISFFSSKVNFEEISLIGNKNVSSGDFHVLEDQIKINGTSITFQTPASNTAKDNAIALFTAINRAKIEGITASLSLDNNKVIIKKTNGGTLDIDGVKDALDFFGLEKTSIQAKEPSTKKGLFFELYETLSSLTSSSNGTLTTYEKSLADIKKNLSKELEKSTKNLDDKYLIMAKKFASYDAVIAQMNNQFKALQSMIDAQANSKR